VALVAPGPEVVEHQSEVRPRLDRYLVIGVEVAIAAIECLAELLEDVLGRRHAQACLSKQPDELWFPAAVDAAPDVPLETEDAQAAVVCVITSCACLAPEVIRAASVAGQYPAAIGGAFLKWQRRHLDVVSFEPLQSRAGCMTVRRFNAALLPLVRGV